MQYQLKNISYTELLKKFDSYVKKANQLQNSTELNPIDSINSLREIIIESKETLKKHISPEIKFLIYLLDSCLQQPITIYDKVLETKSDSQNSNYIDDEKAICALGKIKGYLGMIHSFSKNKTPQIKSINHKKDFILSMLLIAFGDNFYKISIILDLNNILYRQDEPVELAQDLFNRNYVIIKQNYNSDYVKLSVKGASYIERKLASQKNKKRKTEKKQDENFDKKLDEVLVKLAKLGLGQEIIFEEIEELRSLNKKLSKKSLKQILKGKLFDLTLSELINKETANFIYQSLANEKLKLIE